MFIDYRSNVTYDRPTCGGDAPNGLLGSPMIDMAVEAPNVIFDSPALDAVLSSTESYLPCVGESYNPDLTGPSGGEMGPTPGWPGIRGGRSKTGFYSVV